MSSGNIIAIIKKAVNINMQDVDIHSKNKETKGCFMKWNTEWVDLQNMERMVAECWRMGEYQMEKYVRKLSVQQDLIFAGELGLKFLQLLQKSVDEEKPLDWAKLQKDIHLMQELIQDGQAQYDIYWKSQYQELSVDTDAYFGTEFGRAFTEQIAAKLELNISEEQRMLQHDITKIQKICSSCNWEDEEKAKKALLLLTRDEKYYFSSWLGDAFINVLQQRYGKKEAEEESDFIIQPEEAVRTSSLKAKIAWALFIAVSIGLILFLVYLQSDGGRGKEKLQNLFSEITEAVQNKTKLTEKRAESDQDSMRQEKTENMYALNSDVAADENADEDADEDADEQEHVSEVTKQTKVSAAESVHIPDKNTADTGTEEDQKPAVLDILPQYQSFYQKYPDLFGWLKIPGVGIDRPVMQSDDEERGERYYYLHRDYTGQKSEEGSLFVEEASSCYPQDGNTVIYGHNMSSGRGFGMLEQYKDPEFYKDHALLRYDTVYETGTYRIAAVLLTRILYQDEEGFRYYRFYNYRSKEEFQQCADFVKENQLYDTGEQLQYGDRLLMLSTCEYSRPNGRLVVVARKIK
uniref:SrtB family sortase n=1 Tax=Eubacterium plexicaudatum ASF492 TaxID=1235802 RepID=N2AKA2_9FIRM